MPEFNFKSPIVTRKVRETELILEEVIPSPFFIEKELKDINIVEAEAALDIYKEVGIMLDADGRVILDKSINYGKQ